MTRMKESGIDWIGQIPEEWEVVRLQDIGDYRKGPFGSAITIDMFIEKSPCSYKVYEQKNAIKGNCEIGEAYIPKSVYNNLKNFSVYPLDIIVSCAGTIGKCYILPEDCEQGIINQALMRVRVNKSVNLEYFLYIFDIVLSYAAIKYSNGSAIKNIPPFNVLNKLRVTLPSNIEQHQIVNYLDKKTAQLDKVKSLLEEQIQKLKDYRASLIYETVTKGLDKNVPMKYSGIDWIGQVPEGWGVSRLKYYFDIYAGGDIDERNTVEEYTESHPYPVLSNSLENDGVLGYTNKYRFKNNCVTVTGRGDVGKAVYRNIKFYPVVRLLVCVPKSQVDCRFVTYWINSAIIEKNQTAVSQLTIQMLGELIFTNVPYVEQKKIADFLDEKTVQIDKLIQIKNQQIKNINKQRQTLIYDYVTGKRRV